ncbi:MAG: MMPL family transporter [Verrucomicrobiales bacterium]|jgi:hopanoid biosynthesis associated RND transporter like protein HpnN|nr:MMPL family transporter [Verrucomicrobiales bacterium]
MRVFIQGLMRATARLTYRYAWWVIITALAATAASVWLAVTRLGVLNDTNALIRQDSPVLRHYLDYLREFNTRDPMLIVARSPDFAANTAVMEELAARIGAEVPAAQVRDIYYKNDLSRMQPHFLLYQSRDDLAKMLGQIRAQKNLLGHKGQAVNLNRLLDGAIEQFDKVDRAKGKGTTLDDLEAYSEQMIVTLEALARELSLPVGEATNRAANMLNAEIDEFEQQLALNTYIQFEQGQLLLMTLTPGLGDEQSFSPYATGIRQIQRIIAEVRQRHPTVQIGLTGEAVLMNDELLAANRDMLFASLLAAGLIALSFFYAYRQLVRPALALLALGCGIAWSYGMATLAVGHLNIITEAFVLMMLGLGIDFSIQFVGRYEEMRHRGMDLLAALEDTMQHTGVAVVTGGGTTAAAFFTMCFNDFIGLSEMGIIAGSGILLCLLSSLVLFPALITVVDSRRPNGGIRPARNYGAAGRRLDQVLTSRPALALTVCLIVSVFLGWQIDRVKFDYNLLNLQNPKIESVQLAQELTGNPQLPFIFGVVVADDLAHAATLTRELEAKPTVSSVISPTKILPEDQNAKLTVLRQLKQELDQIQITADPKSSVNLTKAKTTLKTILQYSEEGQKEAVKWSKRAGGGLWKQVVGKGNKSRIEQVLGIFERLLPALRQSIEALDKLPAKEAVRRLNRYEVELIGSIQKQFAFLKGFDFEHPVTVSDLPEQARNHYISPNGKILLEIYPKENVMERAANERFVADLRSIDRQATGTPVQNYTYISVLKESYQTAAWYALAAIVIMVLLHFRNLWHTLLALLPLGFGILWMVGIMGWLGLPFNPANIITLPLVIGIGVAYGIYVVDRYREEGRCALFSGSTGKAIVMSALTTIIGFGSMMIGDYRGLVSLGTIMSLGVCCCFVTSTLMLSQVFALLARWRKE